MPQLVWSEMMSSILQKDELVEHISKWKPGLPSSLWDVISILLCFLHAGPPHFSSLHFLPRLWWSQLTFTCSVIPTLNKRDMAEISKVLAAAWIRAAGTCLSKTTAGETWWNAHIYRWPCSIYNVKLESLRRRSGSGWLRHRGQFKAADWLSIYGPGNSC